MKVPKRIEILLNLRRKAALALLEYDEQLQEWARKRGIEITPPGHVMIYTEPDIVLDDDLEAIRQFDPSTNLTGIDIQET